jgi:hypothetical protein
LTGYLPDAVRQKAVDKPVEERKSL